MLLEDLLQRNRAFVAGRPAQPLPAAEAISLAVVACYDPRLDPLLRPALGLAEGEGFMIRTAGALVTPDSNTLRSLALAVYLFEVDQILVVGHSSCRMASFSTGAFVEAFRSRGVTREAFGDNDLRDWAGAIATPRDGVLASASAIASSPFLPRDLTLSGVVLDDTTGGLEMVLKPGDPVPGRILERYGDSAATQGDEPPPLSPPPLPSEAAPGGTAPEEAAPDSTSAAPLDTRHPSLQTLETVAWTLARTAKGEDLGRLRGALQAEPHPARKLALLRGFVKQAAADSREVTKAFAVLQHQAGAVGYDAVFQAMGELFGPLINKEKS